ncbi:MAG: transcription-repair coupling factor [Planctomycetota bacterium]
MSADPAWLRSLAESRPLRALTEQVEATGRASAAGSHGSSAALVAGALAQRLGRGVLYVVAHLDEADDALDDLEAFGGDLSADRFPALEVLPGESAIHAELVAQRIAAVDRIDRGDHPDVWVAPIQALMQAAPRPESLDQLRFVLRVGLRLSPAQLFDWLDRAGYQRTDAVDQPGEFATRGGIVDIHPPGGDAEDRQGRPAPIGPIRIDFFGDEIDSLARIDDDGLGASLRLDSASILSANAQGLAVASATKQDSAASITGGGACPIDLLPESTAVVLHEPAELGEQARGYFERLTEQRGVYAPKTVLAKCSDRPHISIHQYSPADARVKPVALPVGPLPAFEREAAESVPQLAGLSKEHQTIVRCGVEAERHRLSELIGQHAPESAGRIELQVGRLTRGFVWAYPELPQPFALVPHHELFHRYAARRRVRKIATGPGASDAFLDLEPGDYVVHIEQGIARFAGLKTLRRKQAGAGKGDAAEGVEHLTLEFAEGARLHVPAAQIDLIQKYVGGFEGKPPLSTLCGKRWKQQTQQVAEAVKDLAAELLRVQAARETQPGITYPADTPWQHDFEAAFPFDETPDQLAAVAAMKRDMAQPRPMDRLICGDVGFGKTEVALRAVFKAIEYGKQVAVLAPTTVLVEQHERTFKARLAEYPFRVESLSRFKTDAQAKAIFEDAAAGRVDVLIGTHRLLSDKMKFSDLGLVVIDEEQRFGVEHKNKLLRLRLTADVLTLSATPIPRTLHMSMVGLRDISSLTTAPVDRRAIVTEVAPWDDQRVARALQRELARDGQVYVVHNRIAGLQTLADDIARLAPGARIVTGHGQMPTRQLEKVMLAFTRREADVLVSTTIIESGIDIATANTMFIQNADRFGLAELHQLRGRVGRGKHRAYCYLMLPPQKSVSEVAVKRLKAIEGYSMLGAGFKIAMRDLEIRGAGNLLGAEQSGHIAAVGYEMYCRLLEQATRRLKQSDAVEPARTHLELGVAGGVPKRYIPSDKHRIDAYRRLSRVASHEELDAVVAAITDAFGDPPEALQRFVALQEVRVAAAGLEVETLKRDGPDLIFQTAGRSTGAAKVLAALQDAPGRATQLDDATVYYRPPSNYLDPPETMLAVLRKILVRPVRERASEAATVAG